MKTKNNKSPYNKCNPKILIEKYISQNVQSHRSPIQNTCENIKNSGPSPLSRYQSTQASISDNILPKKIIQSLSLEMLCNQCNIRKSKYHFEQENSEQLQNICSKCLNQMITGANRKNERLNRVEEFNIQDTPVIRYDIKKDLTEDQKQRKVQLDNFCRILKQTRDQCSKQNKKYEKKVLQYEHYSELTVFQLKMEYNRMKELLEKEMQTWVCKVQTKYQKEKIRFNRIQEQTTSILDDVDSTLQDIQQNLDKIICRMDESPFQKILSQYDEKIQKYQQFIKKISPDSQQDNEIQQRLSNPQGTIKNKHLDQQISLLMEISKEIFGSLTNQQNSTPQKTLIQLNKSESPIKDNILKQINHKSQPNVEQISFQNKEIFQNALKQGQLELQRQLQQQQNQIQILQSQNVQNSQIQNKKQNSESTLTLSIHKMKSDYDEEELQQNNLSQSKKSNANLSPINKSNTVRCNPSGVLNKKDLPSHVQMLSQDQQVSPLLHKQKQRESYFIDGSDKNDSDKRSQENDVLSEKSRNEIFTQQQLFSESILDRIQISRDTFQSIRNSRSTSQSQQVQNQKNLTQSPNFTQQ